MDVTKRNLETFNNGIAMALKKSKGTLLEFGSEIVTDFVAMAAEAYQNEKGADGKGVSLTGNLLNSIAGGIYINGRIARVITAEVAPETHTYAYVGDGPFKEYGTGDTVYFVFQYNKPYEFQKVDSTGTGRDSAFKFLESYTPKSKIFEIVVCAAAPYAGYLRNVRNLNVLTINDREKKQVWNRAKKNIQIVQI